MGWTLRGRDGAGRRRRDGSGRAGPVAAAALVVATSALVAGFGAEVSWVFEALTVAGGILGLGVAFGALDRARPRWPASRRAAAPGVPGASSRAAAFVTHHLDALDPVEHRRLRLDHAWPAVIVGPTGVVAVSVAGDEGSATRLGEVVAVAESVAATLRTDHPIDVRGLLVGAHEDDGATGTTGSVRQVEPADVAAEIARGNLLPMVTVDELYARLSGALAAELHVHAV